ncbi:MAG TPA: hypothetical protein VNF71_11350 [Acidimicrobiales bacterium]|nr:hypothetical protein [Acidimicrobiales bacterium]
MTRDAARLRHQGDRELGQRGKSAEATGHTILNLQRQAGNGAVTALLRPAPGPAVNKTGRLSSILREAAGSTPAPSGPVVSGDRRAEFEADQVANRAVSVLGGPLGGPVVSAGRLNPDLQRAMALAEPGLKGLDRVSFRTDPASAGEADRLGARAFARETALWCTRKCAAFTARSATKVARKRRAGCARSSAS